MHSRNNDAHGNRSGLLQVRLNFLSTLIDEAYGHLHRHLTASILHRKLFCLPRVTAHGAAMITESLEYCRKVMGVIVVNCCACTIALQW